MSCDPVMTHATPGPGHGSQPRRGDPVTWGVVTRERSRAYGHRWRRLRDAAIARQPWCTSCGSPDSLQGDHVIPVSRGGLTAPGNIQVLCGSCNARKAALIARTQLSLDAALARHLGPQAERSTWIVSVDRITRDAILDARIGTSDDRHRPVRNLSRRPPTGRPASRTPERRGFRGEGPP